MTPHTTILPPHYSEPQGMSVPLRRAADQSMPRAWGLAQSLSLSLAMSATLVGCQPADTTATASPGHELSKVSKFNGVDLSAQSYGRTLGLPDLTGKVRQMDEFKGKVVVLFFGYTSCPDFCPGTMLELQQVKQALGEQGRNVQGIFVTVDPERDQPELLGPYVDAFKMDMIALRGSVQQTRQLASEFKVYFAKVEGKKADTYTMEHTAGVYLIDPQGRLRAFLQHGMGATAMAEDIRAIMASAPVPEA